MKRKFVPALKVVSATLLAALTVGFALAGPATAAPTHVSPNVPVTYHTGVISQGTVRPALAWKSWSWGSLNSGDCTMFPNATWTLYSDGSASFDGTVSSTDDNDAWLMWLHLRDSNGAEIGMLENRDIANPFDLGEFVKDLPSSDSSYRWFGAGFFNSSWFDAINGMSMTYHC